MSLSNYPAAKMVVISLVDASGLKNEGWFDPWLYLQAFKRKVIAMGVNFVAAAVSRIAVEEGKVHSVKVIELQDAIHVHIALPLHPFIN